MICNRDHFIEVNWGLIYILCGSNFCTATSVYMLHVKGSWSMRLRVACASISLYKSISCMKETYLTLAYFYVFSAPISGCSKHDCCLQGLSFCSCSAKGVSWSKTATWWWGYSMEILWIMQPVPLIITKRDRESDLRRQLWNRSHHNPS